MGASTWPTRARFTPLNPFRRQMLSGNANPTSLLRAQRRARDLQALANLPQTTRGAGLRFLLRPVVPQRRTSNRALSL